MRVFSEAVVVNKSLLNSGGFGSVYIATLPSLSSDVMVLKEHAQLGSTGCPRTHTTLSDIAILCYRCIG